MINILYINKLAHTGINLDPENALLSLVTLSLLSSALQVFLETLGVVDSIHGYYGFC